MTQLLLIGGLLLLAAHSYVVRRATGITGATRLSEVRAKLTSQPTPWWTDGLLALGVLLGAWGCWRLYGF